MLFRSVIMLFFQNELIIILHHQCTRSIVIGSFKKMDITFEIPFQIGSPRNHNEAERFSILVKILLHNSCIAIVL